MTLIISEQDKAKAEMVNLCNEAYQLGRDITKAMKEQDKGKQRALEFDLNLVRKEMRSTFFNLHMADRRRFAKMPKVAIAFKPGEIDRYI